MNQILITEKLYVTPELKRKKKLYKINFFLSVFLVCTLCSMYIYAEYDRNKNEEVSKEILSSISLEQEDNTTIRLEDNVLIVTLNEEESNNEEIDITYLAKETQEYIQNVNNEEITVIEEQQSETIPEVEQLVHTTQTGEEYTTDAILNIPSLNINYPVLLNVSGKSSDMEKILKVSLAKFWGGNPNEVGNYVIVGHNYRNKKMFGRLSEMKIGDTAELTDLKGRTITYKVYDRYIVSPEDTACTSQNTNGNKEITLITCTNYGTQRLVLKAKEVK